MVGRGRRTIASRILEGLEDLDEEGCFLVIYDFHIKPSLYFYNNVEVIQKETEDIVKLQNSVIQCRMLKTARALEKLAIHYGANVKIFRADLISSAGSPSK